MQNAEFTASVNVLNLGLADDEATVTAYVDGVAVATSTAVAVPMNHKLNDAGTQLTANFVYAKTGTVPVYLEVKAGDFTVATDPVDVTFLAEVAVAAHSGGDEATWDERHDPFGNVPRHFRKHCRTPACRRARGQLHQNHQTDH